MRTLVMALGLLLAAAAAQANETVRVGVTDRPDNAALMIAKARGYFTRQGIDLDLVGGGNAAQDFVASLSLGQIDVTDGSPSAGLFNALSRGIDIRIVGDWAHVGGKDDSTFALVGRADLMDSGALKGPDGLKGQAVGVGPVHGGINDILIDGALRLGGLRPGDIDQEIIGFGDGIAALSSHRVAATLLIEPLVTLAAEKKVGRVLVPIGAVAPGAELAVVYYSSAFAARTDLATRYMAAYLEGERDYADALIGGKDRDAVIGLLVKNTSMKDAALWAKIAPQHVDLNGGVNVADLKKQAEFYQQAGMLSGPVPDIDKYVDPRFAEGAVKMIGKR